MRKYLVFLAVLLFCVQAEATVYYHIHEPLQNTTGEAITGATYHIYQAGTTDTVAVYSNRAGTRTYQGSGNLQTGADGMIDVYTTARCVDIYYSHSGWSLTGTIEDYCYGIADSVGVGPVTATTLTVTGETTLGDAKGDTIKTRGNFWTKGNNVYRDWAGDAMWFYEMSGTRRLGTDTDRVLGIGASFALEEDIGFTRALAATDTVDGTGDFELYLDRPVMEMREQAGKAYTYQTLDISNTRGYADRWKWGGYVGDYGGDYGAPPVAIRLRSDLPDSNGATGYRTAVQIVWNVPDDANAPRVQILNGDSMFLELYENAAAGGTDVAHYQFARDRFLLGSNASDVSKYIILTTSDGNEYLRIGTSTTASHLRVANRTLDIKDDDDTDDAKLKVSQVYADTLNVKTGTTLFVSAADGQDDATLNVYGANLGILNVSFGAIIDTLKAGSGTTLYMRANDGQDDATLDVNKVNITHFFTLTPMVAPPSGSEGRVYMDTDHHLYVHNGTTWVQLDN